jgi:hypothetical protein
MKTILYALLAAALMASPVVASNDPVKDFLQGPRPDVRDPGYYDTDKVLRLDVDLQGNGQIETLVTLNRDRDGKQGNIWQVYKKSADGYQQIGQMTFSPERFYVGPISEIGKYGLVTFGPGGGGTGIVGAYIYDGATIQGVMLSKVTGEVDSTTGDRKENKALKKYLHDKVTEGDTVIKKIDSKELAKKYGLKIEAKSYKDALKDGFQGTSGQ